MKQVFARAQNPPYCLTFFYMPLRGETFEDGTAERERASETHTAALGPWYVGDTRCTVSHLVRVPTTTGGPMWPGGLTRSFAPVEEDTYGGGA